MNPTFASTAAPRKTLLFLITYELTSRDYVKMIAEILNIDPELAFIDVGSNVGQFSLVAASMGRKVIAVEALKKHALMLGRALVMTGYQSQVKIVHNALSNPSTQHWSPSQGLPAEPG